MILAAKYERLEKTDEPPFKRRQLSPEEKKFAAFMKKSRPAHPISPPPLPVYVPPPVPPPDELPPGWKPSPPEIIGELDFAGKEEKEEWRIRQIPIDRQMPEDSGDDSQWAPKQ